jgi:hypothetical protein
MPVPNINPTPFQNIGSTLAGGAVMPAALAEAQGESLGANTKRAIAEANAQFAKNQALNDPALESKLAAVNGGSPQLGAALGGLLRAGVNPEQTFSAIGTNQATGEHVTVANPDATAPARVAAAQSLSPAGLANPLSDARQQLITAQAGSAAAAIPGNVRLQNAKAALAEAQAAHPELFHPSSSLNMPANPAELRALYQLGVLDPATANRASISGPAVHAAYLAAFPEDAPAPGAAPVAPGAAPPAGPGALPPLAPGGNAHAEIKQSDMQFASVKPTDPGGKIRAGNALTAHLGLLQQLHDAQQANDAPTIQRIATQLGIQAGSDAGTTAALAAHVVGDELNSFLVANGGAEEERKQMQGHFNQATLGAAQLQSNINEGRDLMGGQFAALKKAYSAPSARTDAQVSNFSKRYLLDPSVLDKWEAAHGAVTRGGAAPTAPPVATPGPPVAPPVATPGPPAALPPYNPQQPVPGVDFADEATAQQAAAKGIIKSGQKIRINGQTGTWH